MKEIWFQYIVDNKKYWANGFTLRRLEKVKDAVLSDTNIMWDLLERHNAKVTTPQQMRETFQDMYNHCVDNFSCNVANKMREIGILK